MSKFKTKLLVMPFQEIMDFPTHRKIGIYHMTESESCLLKQLPEGWHQQDQLETIRHPEKRMEWITARLLLDQLCRSYGIEFQEIAKQSNGKPYLPGSSYELSISHSFPFVSVIMDPARPVGIDLEQPKPKLLKIAPRFLGQDELEFAGDDLEMLCILWCAKEALYKILSRQGVIFNQHFSIQPFTRQPKGIIHTRICFQEVNQEIPLYYEDRGDYVFAFNC